MFELNPVYNVNCYPYRTAVIDDARIKISLQSDEARIFIAELAKAAEVREDNHVVYEIKSFLETDKNPLYVFVSDNYMYIGTKIIKGNW